MIAPSKTNTGTKYKSNGFMADEESMIELPKKGSIKVDCKIGPPLEFKSTGFILDHDESESDMKEINTDFYKLEPCLNNSWIQTYSGTKFYPLNPTIETIDLQDIAHSLSMLCRFTGHSKYFYSVAQHSVLVSYICDKKNALHGLLHDASEAYLGDISSPLKRSGEYETYKKYEAKLQTMICRKFGLDQIEPADVKNADAKLLATEARDLMSPLHKEWTSEQKPLPFKIEALPPDKAKELFMARYRELIDGK